MTRAHCLSLSDYQLKFVMSHAAGLPMTLRDKYLQRIADQLRGEPSDSALAEAVNRALNSIHSFLEVKS
jgi:hypothetical protein